MCGKADQMHQPGTEHAAPAGARLPLETKHVLYRSATLSQAPTSMSLAVRSTICDRPPMLGTLPLRLGGPVGPSSGKAAGSGKVSKLRGWDGAE